MALQVPDGVLHHRGQVLQRLRRVSGHEKPQSSHSGQPGIYGYTGGPYAVRGHGCIRHAKEGPYQDRPPLRPFRLLPLLTCS